MSDKITKLVDSAGISKLIKRISHEILESSNDKENLVIIGIKSRGDFIAKRITNQINNISGIDIPGPYQGVLPITIIHIIYSFDKTSQTILERIINTSDISHRDNLILKTLENTEIKEQRSLPVPQTRVNNKLKSNIFKFMKI